MSRVFSLLKLVGISPISQEFSVGDRVASKTSGRVAIVLGFVPSPGPVRAKIIYQDNDQIEIVDATDLVHAPGT